MFTKFVKHSESIMYKKMYMGVFDSMLVKYGALMVGYAVVGLPVFGPNREEYLKRVGNDASAITRDYVRNSSLLINLAKAIGRLVISYKEIQQLAGFTTLVYEMKQVLEDLDNGQFVRTQVIKEEGDAQAHKVANKNSINSLNTGKTVFTDDYIKFNGVPIVSPNGDCLVPKIDFEVRGGMNTVVTGPNGCGKSSLFRILSGLWPTTGGVLERPHMDKLFYIPQRPYLPPGTLRDQIIYPHSKITMNKRHLTDDVPL
jgi:ATP-binding cassette, subfamily D (ALD), member 3